MHHFGFRNPAPGHDVVSAVRDQAGYCVSASQKRHCCAVHYGKHDTEALRRSALLLFVSPQPHGQQCGTGHRLKHRYRGTPEFLLSQYTGAS